MSQVEEKEVVIIREDIYQEDEEEFREYLFIEGVAHYDADELADIIAETMKMKKKEVEKIMSGVKVGGLGKAMKLLQEYAKAEGYKYVIYVDVGGDWVWDIIILTNDYKEVKKIKDKIKTLNLSVKEEEKAEESLE